MTSEEAEITSIVSSEGMSVPCRYLESPYFDSTSNLCMCLHWMFVLYGPSRSYSNSYLLRSGIEHFLEFIWTYNTNQPKPLRAVKYTDINSEIFTKFINHLQENSITLSAAEKLKTAMTVVARDTGKLPEITLPAVPIRRSRGKSPLHADGFESLKSALETHTQALFDKLRFRKLVDKAEPYNIAEIKEILSPRIDRNEIFRWLRNLEIKEVAAPKSVIATIIARCPDSDIQAIAESADRRRELRRLYKNTCGNTRLERDRYFAKEDFENYKRPESFNSLISLETWDIDPVRAMRTLLDHGYPFKYEHSVITVKFRISNLKVPDRSCKNVIDYLMYRLVSLRSQYNSNAIRIDHLLSLYYPTLIDMSAIVIFLMLQSGWNNETVLSIDKDNFEHALTSTIEPAVKVIFSEKERSQGNGKPYHDAVRNNLPTRDDDPYSAYTLIRLAAKLSQPLFEIPFDIIPTLKQEDSLNSLFLCIRSQGDWQKGGRHTSSSHGPAFRSGVKQFLSTYEVYDNGKRLLSAKDLTRRLRPTWLLYKKKHNPIALLSMSMSHTDPDITDIYYDSSPLAKRERLHRLRSEIEAVLTLLRTRQFKGIIGAQAQAEASANLKVFHIPGQRRPLWGCANQSAPDWIGSEVIAATGGICWELRECIFCSQMRIFEDSLPYLMERTMHLEEIIEHGHEGGFATRAEKELEAIRFILDAWGDESEIATAARYRRRNSPLLPRDLKFLKVILESEIAHA